MSTTTRLSRPTLTLLVALLLLRTVLLLAGAGISGAVTAGIPHAAEWLTIAGNLFVVPVDLITLAVVAWAIRREGGTPASLLGRFRPSDLGWGALIGLGLLVALFVGTFAGNLIVYQGPPPMGSFDPTFRTPLWFGLWCLMVAPLTIAFAEELLYRAYLQPRWIERLGAWPALLLVALFFGVQHIAFVLTSPGASFVKVFATFLGGLLLGWLYRRTGRLWPLVLGHWLADVIGLGLPMMFLVG